MVEGLGGAGVDTGLAGMDGLAWGTWLEEACVRDWLGLVSKPRRYCEECVDSLWRRGGMRVSKGGGPREGGGAGLASSGG